MQEKGFVKLAWLDVRYRLIVRLSCKRKYWLHKAALPTPSNSRQRLFKTQRTCGGKIHKPIRKENTN